MTEDRKIGPVETAWRQTQGSWSDFCDVFRIIDDKFASVRLLYKDNLEDSRT